MKKSEKLFLAGLVLCAPSMHHDVALVMAAVAMLAALALDWRGK